MARKKSSTPNRGFRVADQIQRDLTELIARELKDPRVGMVTIQAVEVTPDYAHAKVYFSLPTGGASGPATAAMRRARGFFRSHLAKVLNMRYTPDLLFFFDHQNEEAQRIDDLFRQIEKERKDEPS